MESAGHTCEAAAPPSQGKVAGATGGIPRLVEFHYSTTDVAVSLRRSERWVREKIKAGEFGSDVYLIDGDFLLPASAVNMFLATHRFAYSTELRARNEAELRRRLTNNKTKE